WPSRRCPKQAATLGIRTHSLHDALPSSPARQSRGDDRSLKRCSVRRCRMGPETRVAEVQFEQIFGIVLLAAIRAGRVGAILLAKLGDQRTDARERLVDPNRKDRVAAGDADPAQRERKRKSVFGGIGQVSLDSAREPCGAAPKRKPLLGQLRRYRKIGRLIVTDGAQALVERVIMRDE